MMFIVTLVALLIERFFDWSHLRHWTWYVSYQRMVEQRFSTKPPYLILVCILAPLLLATGIISLLLQNWLYGFAKLLFDIVLFIYCLGPKNLWADAFGNGQEEVEVIASKNPTYSQSMQRHLLDNIFIEANRRVFAVVFWYVILGAVGIVMYRTVTLTATGLTQEEVDVEVTQSARSFEAILNWAPIRIFTFLFALGGHFSEVLSYWRKNVLLGLSNNEIMLTECGAAALNGSSDEKNEKVTENRRTTKNTIYLLDRAFIIMLVMVAVVAWV